MSRSRAAVVWVAFLLGIVGLYGTLSIATYEISSADAFCYDPREDAAVGEAWVSWVPPGVECHYRSVQPPGEILVPVPQGRTVLMLLGASSIAVTWKEFDGWGRRIAQSLLGTATVLFILGVAISVVLW